MHQTFLLHLKHIFLLNEVRTSKPEPFFFSFFFHTPPELFPVVLFFISVICVYAVHAFSLHLKTVLQKTQVMFPVLQVSKVKNLSDVGHYFLLVLNIRNARFEVLGFMRTLEDTNLRTCCDKLMESIKKLWSEHYPDSKV
jgi:hypothetical protein